LYQQHVILLIEEQHSSGRYGHVVPAVAISLALTC
jgi:hypothetical protein